MQSTTQPDDKPTPPSTPAPAPGPSTTNMHRPLGLRAISIFFRFGIILVVLVVAAGIVAVMISTKVESAQSDAALMSVQVRTIEAQLRAVDRTWDGYGTARSMNDASVVAEVGGRVIERPSAIEAGQKISVGTILLRLDSSDYTNALNAAQQAASAIEAQLDGLSVESERVGTQIELASDEIDAAQRDLERTKQAIEAGAGNVGELDIKTAAVRRVQREVQTLKERLELIPSRRAQLLAQLASQRAGAATAQENLDRAVIRSPIAGVIQSAGPREGDWVALGTPIARVIDLSQLEIPVRLPASAIRWIELGDAINLWEGDPIGEPDQVGIITRIAPEADTASRTITVFVEVEQDPNAADRLNPGRFVFGRVRSPDDQPRFVVPRRSIQSSRVMIAVPQDSGSYRIEVRPVTTAYSIEGKIESLDPNEDQWTVVTSGLSHGDLVVVSLLDQISDGLLVQVIGRQDESGTQP